MKNEILRAEALQNRNEIIVGNKDPHNYIPHLVSCTFTGIITAILVMNMNVPIYFPGQKEIIFIGYYAVFSLIIWAALIKR